MQIFLSGVSVQARVGKDLDGLVEALQIWPLDLPNVFQEQFPHHAHN